ncbi:uncharacterized protein LOC125873876 [Solanum stenotomum]|uniref:uncharacterized protein LOC125873876 n=1 Tax=Solanum stenotomum TaxID=172797 RepID=UPI0020D09BBA|nr:uncharacterized protein LOC125873876 [Solanum stenotomum]
MKFNVIQFLGRPSVKRELVNIWNSKLQAQGECTCTRDGELKEEFAPTKTKNFVDSGIQWRDFHTLQTVLEQTILIISILYSVSLLASCILLAIHWFLIPLIKTSRRVPKFSNRLIRSLFRLWRAQHLI